MGLPNTMYAVNADEYATSVGQVAVSGAVVRMRAHDDLLPALDAYLTHPRRRLFPQRGAYQRIAALRDRLADAVRVGADDLSFITEDDLREVDRFIIVDGRFQFVHCPVCGRDYRPDELDVHDWTRQWPDTAWGGKRWICPGGHTILARRTWIN